MVLTTGILYDVLADLFIFLVYHLFLRRVMDDYYMAQEAEEAVKDGDGWLSLDELKKLMGE